MLDHDGNGRITKADMKILFKGKTVLNDAVIKDMFEEAGCASGCYKITFPDFKKMMLSNLKSAFLQEQALSGVKSFK